jgi:predicted nucleic acid-binding protein
MALTVVVDANVFVALVVEESLTPAARRFFSQPLEIHIPYLCVAEVGHGILKHFRRGRYEISRAYSAFELFLNIPKTVHAPNQSFSMDDFRACATSNLGTGDYQYVRLAGQLAIPLVTSDRGLFANAKSQINILDLRNLPD